MVAALRSTNCVADLEDFQRSSAASLIRPSFWFRRYRGRGPSLDGSRLPAGRNTLPYAIIVVAFYSFAGYASVRSAPVVPTRSCMPAQDDLAEYGTASPSCSKVRVIRRWQRHQYRFRT
jgi:hypothetical protein